MQYERRKKYDKIGKTFKDSDFEKTYFSLIVKFDSKQEIDTFKENSLLKSDDHYGHCLEKMMRNLGYVCKLGQL